MNPYAREHEHDLNIVERVLVNLTLDTLKLVQAEMASLHSPFFDRVAERAQYWIDYRDSHEEMTAEEANPAEFTNS